MVVQETTANLATDLALKTPFKASSNRVAYIGLLIAIGLSA